MLSGGALTVTVTLPFALSADLSVAVTENATVVPSEPGARIGAVNVVLATAALVIFAAGPPVCTHL